MIRTYGVGMAPNTKIPTRFTLEEVAQDIPWPYKLKEVQNN
jgi:hypothetical protein